MTGNEKPSGHDAEGTPITMPTDNERREIAARLRNRRREMESEKPPTDSFFAAFVYLTNVMGAVRVGEDGNLFNRLADLIEPEPERTCHDDYDGRQFRCSECGAFIHLLKRDDAFDWEFVYPDFCPFCGAKVVGE